MKLLRMVKLFKKIESAWTLSFCANFTTPITENCWFIERSVVKMVLFIILAIIAVLLTGLTVFVVSTMGTIGIVLFADVIVCILIIAWIIKRLWNRR